VKIRLAGLLFVKPQPAHWSNERTKERTNKLAWSPDNSRFTDYSYLGLFVPWTIRTFDGLFVPWTVRTVDCSYPPGLFVPWTVRTVPGRFVPCWERQHSLYSVSQKNLPLRFSDIFFQNGWEFSGQILQAYCTFIPTVDFKFLFN